MARIIRRIPENYQSSLATIISLSENKINQFLKVLEEAPIALNVKTFNQQLLSKIDFLDSKVANNLIETIGSLYELNSELDITTEEFVDEIIDVMNESGNKAIELSNQNKRKKFKQRLSNVLDVKSLSIRAKAVSLIFEHDNVFQDARLVSDIRPIFGDSTDESPIGTVLVHTLRIEYKNNNEIKNFYVALDDKDVKSLTSSLKRTQAKAESLRNFIEKADSTNYAIE